MEPAFWQSRWEENKIAFHEDRPNALFSAHLSRLALAPGSRVFVPLCGKSNDLGWLADQGHRVVGVELNDGAVAEAYRTLSIRPDVVQAGRHVHYQSPRIEVFVGDFFDLTPELVGSVDAIYDRAALVALPPDMRRSYARFITTLTGLVPQFLISFDYEQSQTEGPPFSVPEEDISALYGDRYTQERIVSVAISGPLAERCSGEEIAWLLSPR